MACTLTGRPYFMSPYPQVSYESIVILDWIGSRIVYQSELKLNQDIASRIIQRTMLHAVFHFSMHLIFHRERQT